MARHRSTYEFEKRASKPKNSVALMYDLEGFSKFFNQPDVQDYIPSFLNHVSNAVSVCLYGGTAYWMDEDEHRTLSALDLRVSHEKFMGDGALYILLPPTGETDFDQRSLQILCNRLWNLKNNFPKIITKALDDVPVVEVPQRIRFGLSRGAVYELKKKDTSAREYIGFCINQASRLQSYCPELGFIASARLRISEKELKEHGYRKVVATKIKGFPNELVVVDGEEFDELDASVKATLFQTL
ncbi:MAG: hypothetical protein JF600_00820 [Xanthomonadales bacterium]|nr:hypothetical protein [Xanthomonadales bacterium]